MGSSINISVVACWLATAGALAIALILSRLKARFIDRARTDGLTPELIAYLYGGHKRTLLAALGSLRAQGLVEADTGKIRLSFDARPNDGSTELQRAILNEAFFPARCRRIIAARSVKQVMSQLDNELLRRGLLICRGVRAVQYCCLWAAWLVLVVGFILSKQESSFLPLLWMAVVNAILVWSGSESSRTRAGDAELERLREVYGEYFGPWHRPSWSSLNSHTAAYYVALYGLDALETTDAGFVHDAGLILGRSGTGADGTGQGERAAATPA